MSKQITVTVSISTDLRVMHIGRYFIDVRDTTGGRNHQMTTRIKDAAGALRFIGDLRDEAARQGVAVIVMNETGGELKIEGAK